MQKYDKEDRIGRAYFRALSKGSPGRESPDQGHSGNDPGKVSSKLPSGNQEAEAY